VRQLDPAKVPASCEQCGYTELAEENRDAWEFLTSYPGVLKPAGGLSAVLYVDYAAALTLAPAAGIAETGDLIQRLEAIAKGYNHARK